MGGEEKEMERLDNSLKKNVKWKKEGGCLRSEEITECWCLR